MTEISKQDIETLVKLQEAESEIVRLQSVLDEVKKEKNKLGVQLKTFKTDLDRQNEEFNAAAKACRDLENEIQIVDARIIKSNENLRMVKTNKEYQVLLREVDDNKKRKDALETQMLEYLEEKDRLSKIVEQTESEYSMLKEQIEAEQGKIEQQSTSDQEDLQGYLDSQKEIGKNLDPFLMNRFAKISKMTNGLAVVAVSNEVCMGCYMNIPPQLYIEVQRANKLISCPQCSRILYHKNQ